VGLGPKSHLKPAGHSSKATNTAEVFAISHNNCKETLECRGGLLIPFQPCEPSWGKIMEINIYMIYLYTFVEFSFIFVFEVFFDDPIRMNFLFTCLFIITLYLTNQLSFEGRRTFDLI
jgi:hypothetical protein